MPRSEGATMSAAMAILRAMVPLLPALWTHRRTKRAA